MNKNIKLKKNLYVLCFCLFPLLMFFNIVGCSTISLRDKNTDSINKKEPISKSSFKLNTIVTITIYDSDDEELLEECMKLCDYYEGLFSRTLTDSEIYSLNHNGTGLVSYETLDIITKGIYYSKLTDGSFNLCILPLVELWDFIKEKKVPDKEKINTALSHIDYNGLVIEGNTITLRDKNSGVDLGAIAKGYIADKIKEYLVSKGVKSALIDLGGNLLLIGERLDGTGFHIGIQKPFEAHSEVIAVMQLKDVSVVSSGIYERYFIEDNQLYHHILDTTTGYPCANELISVTIISKHSVDADALSTSAFTLGLEKGLELINSLEEVYAVFITSDYELIYSKDFEENIPLIK